MERWIWHNGALCDTGGELPRELRLTNAAVQAIAVRDGRALFLDEHLALAGEAYRFLFAADLSFSAQVLQAAIGELLAQNRLPARGGALVRLVAAPGDVALVCAGRLLYPGLQIWHQRLRATRVGCDGGFASGVGCVSGLVDAGYCLQLARLGGFEAAIRSAHGALTGLCWGVWSGDAEGVDARGGVGEWPIFGVREGEVFVPSLESGARESVWRRLGLRTLDGMQVRVHQIALLDDDIEALDELFALTPQGVVGVSGCAGRLFYNAMGERMGELLGIL